MKDNKRKWFYSYILPFFLLLLINILMGLKMQGPIHFPDEAGYLGKARFLSGTSHIIQGAGVYHFGYALFLVPVFWIFSDPSLVYSAVMVINALLMSSLYFGIVYILHVLFEYPKRISLAIAFTTCLYPAFILQTNIAWAENAFIPFYVLYILASGLLLKYKAWWTLILFSLISFFLYTIHPRALLILPISILFLLILLCSSVLTKPKALFGSIIICFGFFITRYVNNFIISFLEGGRSVDSYIYEKVTDVFSPSNFVPFILEVAGEALYLIEATYGLFFLAIIYIGIHLWKKWSTHRFHAFEDIRFSVLILLISSSAAIFFSGSVSILPVTNGQKLIQGRYNEGFLALYIAFALAAIYEGNPICLRKGANPYRTSIIILLLSCVVLLGYDYAKLAKWCQISNVCVINIFGIYPFIGIIRRLDLLVVALFAIAMIFILFYAFKIKFVLGLSVLMAYFIVVSASGYTVLLVRSEYLKSITSLRYAIASMDNVGDVSYDRSYYKYETWYGYQYFLPGVTFNTFYSKKGELPHSRVVISNKSWNGGGKLKAKRIAVENPTAQVPPIIKRLIQLFFDQPLKPEKRVNQALWLVKDSHRAMN